MRRSPRLLGLPPESPPVVEGNERETIYQPTTYDSHVEIVIVIESEEEIPSFQSPIIIQQPSIEDTTFLFLNGRLT